MTLVKPPLSYPGVYVQELPAASRTISGVATSITAFLGRCWMGPVNRPVTLTSWADFERTFGGIRDGYPLGYVVRDYFNNGGQQAILVRLGGSAQAAKGTVTGLSAISPGTWANDGRLSCSLTRLREADLPAGLRTSVSEEMAMQAVDLNFFRLDLSFKPGPGKPEVTESYPFVSAEASAGNYRVDRVLRARSQVAACTGLSDLAAAVSKLEAGGRSDGTFSGGVDSSALTAGDYQGSEAARTGIYALDNVDLFNILCIPPDSRDPNALPLDQAGWNSSLGSIQTMAMQYCVRRRALLLMDAPSFWSDAVSKGTVQDQVNQCLGVLGGKNAANAAIYFPWIQRSNPDNHNEIEIFPPCGAVAGVMARTDATRGVWKAPAGTDASVDGAGGLQVELTDAQNGVVNLQGINCLRTLPLLGTVIWGARTLRGAELLASEWKYVPVRRLALFLEESLYRGTRWAVFEPNDENLWSSLRSAITGFMQDLQRQGAFYDFFVRCDAKTTTSRDIELGIVNVVIGFAPVKPAEFVILYFQQQAAKE